MSYVLDALRRAETERQRGHASPLLLDKSDSPSSGTARASRGPVYVGMALAIMLAALGWGLMDGQSAPDGAGTTATRTPPLAAQGPAHGEVDPPPPAAANAPPTVAPIALHGTAASSAGSTPSLADTPLSPAPILAPEPPNPAPIARATSPATRPAAAPTAPLPRPSLTVSGVTYSENAAHRMLIVNGRVLQEGQDVAPGHTLEAIGQRSAVIRAGSERYNVNY